MSIAASILCAIEPVPARMDRQVRAGQHSEMRRTESSPEMAERVQDDRRPLPAIGEPDTDAAQTGGDQSAVSTATSGNPCCR